jgi:predicted dehydrogenase
VTPLRLAIIGLGPASQPHVKALADLAGTIEVVGAATRSATRAAASGPLPFPVTTDPAALLAHPSADAVLILTPPAAHQDLTLEALAAGKHVLVEKPLAIDIASGDAMVAAAATAKRHLGVVLQHRFRAGAQRLAAALASGELGSIVAASVHVPWWRPQSYYDEPGRGTFARDGGGVLLTQAIHAIDLFHALTGVEAVVAADVRTTALHRMETEDHVHALLTLRGGAPGLLQASVCAYPGRPERIEVIGTTGTAHLEGGALTLSWQDGRIEHVAAEGKSGAGAAIMDFPHDAHRALLADFAEAVTTNRPPRVTGSDALATQRLIDEILSVGRARARGDIRPD